MRRMFVAGSVFALGAIALAWTRWPPAIWALAPVGLLVLLGTWDMLQRGHAVLRNFPLVGHFRYLFEAVRPEINQYFVESDLDGRPFNRVERSIVYQRAKRELSTLPFGTRYDVYRRGSEWIQHSLAPRELSEAPRIAVGGPDCSRPYSCALLNISAMSYGALSTNAIRALNLGAQKGGFAHNTGEGGISPYHLLGGDLVWQIGTGYFGCRTLAGGFDEAMFRDNAQREQVKMIEIKLSQGAKPGHGGILPAAKVSEEIAKIRGVPRGVDVHSPPRHSAFDGPAGMLAFCARLRELSGGKPVGIKLCIGRRHEFLSICKAMLTSGITVDFITVDGAEGGTGAAPLEFSDSIGCPLTEALIFVHNALTGCSLREAIKVLASGRIITGFHLARALAFGADACNSARGMMFALGCIQALRCNANSCPTGVATHRRGLVAGLVVNDKAERVYNFQRETLVALMEIVAAAGLRVDELRPHHIFRRLADGSIRHYGELFEPLSPGELLKRPVPEAYRRAWDRADRSAWATGERAAQTPSGTGRDEASDAAPPSE